MCRGLARAVGGPSGSQNRWLRAFTLATKSPETRRSPAVVVIETLALQWVLRPARQWWTCASGISIAASAAAFNHVRAICAASIPLICREETTSGTTTGITSRLGPRPRFVERPIGCSGRSHLGRFDRVSAVCFEWPAPPALRLTLQRHSLSLRERQLDAICEPVGRSSRQHTAWEIGQSRSARSPKPRSMS